jgi:uncharacterized membrane protein YbhN (UPF0104 family)
MSLERAVAAFAAARPPGLIGALAFFLLSLLWSAEAWRSAVRACGGRTGRRRAAACYGAGSLVNSLLPARLGDAAPAKSSVRHASSGCSTSSRHSGGRLGPPAPRSAGWPRR